jgi:hypothetical protein
VPVDFASNANDNLVTNTIGSSDRTSKDEVNTATATGLTKLGLEHWRPDEWVGYTVEILSGLAAGQHRLITANTGLGLTIDTAWTTVPAGNELFRIYFERLTESVRSGMVELLGVDLRVAQRPLTKTWDLVLDSGGDFSVTRGEDNLNQALMVKLITTQGDLILHPWFGLRPILGRRGTPEALFRLRLFVEQTLLSDSRVEAVESLLVQQGRDLYMTEAKLSIKGGLRSRFVAPLV